MSRELIWRAHPMIMQVHTLIGTKGLLLLIFKDGHGYQFRVVNQFFEVFGQTKTFYPMEAAEAAGRGWIG